MEFLNLLATIKRRWWSGLLAFVLVGGAVLALALRPTSPAPTSPTPATAVTFAQVYRVDPLGETAAEQAAALESASILLGTWVTVAQSEDIRKQALKAAGLATAEDEALAAMTASGADSVVGLRLQVSGLPQADAEKIIDAWGSRALSAVVDVQPRIAGEPIVEFLALGGLKRLPATKEAATPATGTSSSVRSIGWPLALLVGLITGLAAMFVHDALDRRVGSSRQLRQLAGSVPTLAELALPTAAGAASSPAGRKSARRLRAAVMAAAEPVTLVACPQQAPDAGAAAAALARSLAEAGSRTLLVDVGDGLGLVPAADLTATPLLADAITGDGDLAVLAMADDGRLEDVVAGPAMHRLLADARGGFDHVVVSGGGLAGSSTAATLATLTDHTVLVVPVGSPEALVTRALGQLADVRAEVLGVAINRG